MAKRTIGSPTRSGAIGSTTKVKMPASPSGASLQKVASRIGVRVGSRIGSRPNATESKTAVSETPASAKNPLKPRGLMSSGVSRDDKKKIESLQEKLRKAQEKALAKRRKAIEERSDKGLSFARLYANAQATDSKYAGDVAIDKMKKAKPFGYDGFVIKTKTRDTKKMRRYECVVASKTTLPVHRSRKVFVSCNCDRFLYYYEYALTQHGASEIKYSNGRFPVEKNPTLIPSACKHILCAMHEIVQNKL